MRHRVFVLLLAFAASACALNVSDRIGASMPLGDKAPIAPPPAPVDRPAISVYGPSEHWQAITLSASPAPLSATDPAMARVGALTFRGGLHLKSNDPRFGGLSGVHVGADGRLLAVSDEGHWFAAQIVLDDAGALIGLADPRMAPIRGEDGQVLEQKKFADAEGLARLADGRFAVSFERTNLVRLYDLETAGPAAPPVATMRVAGAEDLAENEGLEAITAFGAKVLVGAEKAPKGAGGAFWLGDVEDGAVMPLGGAAVTTDGFGLVAFEQTPQGDVLALERFYAPLIGPRIAVRKIAAAGLRNGQPTYAGETIARFGPPVALDNFEGIAALAQNELTGVYLLSDDNFRKEQKTLLYAFDMEPTAPE
jgi:hypothetical protein